MRRPDVVAAVGPGVDGNVKVGERIAYMNAGLGAYADKRIVPAGKTGHPAGRGQRRGGGPPYCSRA